MSEIAERVTAGVSLETYLQEHLALFRNLSVLTDITERVAAVIEQVLLNGNKLMLCGNGGSAADSQHLAAEFTGRFLKDRKPLAALALSTDSSALTCISNDYSFEDVFSRQVLGLGRPGDCLLGISTSGNSRNVIRAVEAARSMGIQTVGLLGRDGGLLRGICDLSIIVPSPTTARIQEAHIFLGHTLCAMVESRLGLDQFEAMQQHDHMRDRLQKARVLVAGDAMLDRYLFGNVERISPEAPVPVVLVTREEERLGGAANVAFNITSIGANATLITVVGDDEPARRLQQLLESKGVKTILGRDAKLYTCVKLRVIGRAQQLVRVDFENPPDHQILSGMLASFERAVCEFDAVLFSDYGKGGLTHIPRMILAARAAGKLVLVDPKGSDYRRYTGANVITPNRAELAQVIGGWLDEAQLLERAQSLRETLKIDTLVLTRSEEGMSLFDAAGHVQIPALAREVFDVTGAGDTVIATLSALMAGGLTAREALPIANRAGGLVVEKFGTASVSFEELFE